MFNPCSRVFTRFLFVFTSVHLRSLVFILGLWYVIFDKTQVKFDYMFKKPVNLYSNRTKNVHVLFA